MKNKYILPGIGLLLSLLILTFFIILLGVGFDPSVAILVFVILLPIVITVSLFLPDKISFYTKLSVPMICMLIFSLLIMYQIPDFTDFFTGIVMYGDKERVPLHIVLDTITFITFIYFLVLIFLKMKEDKREITY